MNIKDRKRINNLPKFDPGKIALNKGFLSPINTDTSSFTSTPQYDMSNSISALKNSIFPTTASKLTLTGSSIASALGSGFTSFASAAGANTSKYISLFGKDTLKAGVELLMKDGVSEGKAVEKVVEDGLKGSGQNVAKGGLSTAGNILAGVGAAYSGFNLANDIINSNNHLTASDLVSMSGKSTQSKNGGMYDTYTGFNQNQVTNYTKALTTSNLINMLSDTTGLGASVGSFFGPVGTAIGAGAGFLVGGIADLLGFGNNEDEVQRLIESTSNALAGYNNQSESVGSSRGLRNRFYNADQGKPSGKISGYASHDEGYLNEEAPLMESVGYFGSKDFNVKDKREDNVLLRGNIDPLAIIGHKGGLDKLMRPVGKRAEQVKDEFKNTKDPNTKILLINEMAGLRLRAEAIAQILLDMFDREDMKHTLNYKRMNGRKFALGKLGDYAEPIFGAASRFLPVLAETNMVKSERPFAYDTYVPYMGTQPVRLIADYSLQVALANRAARQGVYNINQAGALSPALRQALLLSNNYSNRDAVNTILKAQADKQGEYNQAYLDKKIAIDSRNQQYANQAKESWANRYDKAVGALQNWKVGNLRNWATSIGQSLQDFSTNKYLNKILDLYDRQIENDRINSSGGYGKNVPINTKTASAVTPSTKYGTTATAEDVLAAIAKINAMLGDPTKSVKLRPYER